MTRLMVPSAAQCLSWTRVNCFAFLRIELVPAFRVFQMFRMFEFVHLFSPFGANSALRGGEFKSLPKHCFEGGADFFSLFHN